MAGASKQSSKTNAQSPKQKQVTPSGQQQNVQTAQPQSIGQQVFITLPVYNPIQGVPAGLEPLNGIDAIIVQQHLEIIEILVDIETNNRYSIMNQFGQRMFYAAEQNDCCTRMCLGNSRPFIIRIYDAIGREVMTAERICNFPLFWWGGATSGSDITVKSSTTGELLGRVKQVCSGCTPTYQVFDAQNGAIMKIRGPGGASCCRIIMCCNAQFTVFSTTGNGEEQIGSIQKSFGLQELISDATNFGIRVPPGLHPNLKATLIGAIFCIDFSFFESSNASPPTGCSCLTTLICLVILIVVYLVLLK